MIQPILPKRSDGLCSDCVSQRFVSREGWCRRCLRLRLTEKFGPTAFGHVGTTRTKDQRQEREGDPNPWGENAVRSMEGG